MGPDTNSKYNTLFEMASSTSKDVSHIIKFYGTNFSSWKFGIWRFLEKFKLTSVVDGTESFPAQTLQEGIVTNAALIEAWQQKDVDARTYIYSINPSVLPREICQSMAR
ncbi:hypothetical protein OUZ56_024038 [Daphnia magna]|uniref:Uncharacterized protein n=1 Tax=Daphnia magna TaxID=35525 RepID=A0ABR0AZZ1_9CRUS|nr:hypothetical protein OUZ56_024038 [Daphnia magna]KAK4030699.1 hypothetical protein OUZ56_024038 [Daphnia magna]